MRMKLIPEVGDRVELEAFAFTNRHGGTGLSDDHDSVFRGRAVVRVTKAWIDYECGWRFHGKALSRDLKHFLDRHATRGPLVFFDQFQILKEAKA